ncbi:MAG: fibronectin type III domain-containing protein, partial [Lachnospiraceae bacterium]|nr:fibronectin type III domain-containing protein [Lachnospiraceae bacterium]
DDITNVGWKKVTATAIGTSGYYGTLEKEYRIIEKTISKNNLVKIVPKLRQTEAGVYYADYTGQEIEPEVDVYIDNNGNGVFTDGEKIASSDYNVAYSNNIEASDNALISVTLTGNYAAKTFTRTFTIRGCEFNEDTTTIVVNDRSYDYTGSEITPNITVYQDLVDGSRVELVKDQDYYIPAEGGLTDNVNPGDATVTIRGKGSFTGSRSATFVICADLSNAFDITGNTCNVPTQLYTGDRLTPMVEAVIGGKTLKSGDDFIVGTSVTFTAYDSDNNPTAGTVDITGNNKYYKNTYTASFEVTTDLSQIELSYSGLDNVIYSGQEQKQRGFKIYDPSGNEVSYAEDGVTYESSSDGDACVNVGTVTVTIPITIGTIHSTVTTTYDIVKSNIASALYTGGANSTYTGNPLCPPVELTYRGKELEVNKDYTIVYDNNTKPTSKTSTGATPAPATITITGIGNFYGTYNQEFQIYPERMREVAATPVGANGMIVSWDRLDHVSGYRVDVMKADSAVPVKTVDVSNGNATSTTIDGLAEGTTYSFRAYSYVTVEGTTYYGLLNSITTSTGISTPQISTASTVAKKATVSWRATNAGVKYIIYRSNTANGEYKLIAITKTDASSFTDVGLTRGSTYYYKIRAFRYPDEYGEYSDVSAVTVK